MKTKISSFLSDSWQILGTFLHLLPTYRDRKHGRSFSGTTDGPALSSLSSLERCPRPEEHAGALAGGHPGRFRGQVFSGERRSFLRWDKRGKTTGILDIKQAGWQASHVQEHALKPRCMHAIRMTIEIRSMYRHMCMCYICTMMINDVYIYICK